MFFRLILGLLALGAAANSLNADERILSFESHIQVNADGTLIVTENIRVEAEGKDIKRGIYRDFPTRYKDNRGNQYVVDFNVWSVKRNGNEEPYYTKNTLAIFPCAKLDLTS